MMIADPVRSNHIFFQDPIFHCAAFLQFQAAMEIELDKENLADVKAIEDVIPPVNRRFDRMEDMVARGFQGIRTFMEEHFRNEHRRQQAAIATYLGWNGGSTMFTGAGSTMFPGADLHQGGSDRARDDDDRHHSNDHSISQESRRQGQAESQSDSTEYPPTILPMQFLCVQDMIDCWVGVGRHSGMVDGGIKNLEQKYAAKWRAQWPPADQKRFSRFKAIVLAVGNDRNRIGLAEHQYSKKQKLAPLKDFIDDQNWSNKKTRAKRARTTP